MRRKKNGNLEKRLKGSKQVVNFKPLKDDGGRYIPYCDFGYHQGIVKRPKICEERSCTHYYKFYLRR